MSVWDDLDEDDEVVAPADDDGVGWSPGRRERVRVVIEDHPWPVVVLLVCVAGVLAWWTVTATLGLAAGSAGSAGGGDRRPGPSSTVWTPRGHPGPTIHLEPMPAVVTTVGAEA